MNFEPQGTGMPQRVFTAIISCTTNRVTTTMTKFLLTTMMTDG